MITVQNNRSNERTPSISEEQRWDDLSEEWEKTIGDDGDITRKYSDSLVWDCVRSCVDPNGEKKKFTVLDAGCGTGYLTVKLGLQGYTAIGVDVSAKQLSFAQQKIAKYNLQDHVTTFKASAHHMPSVQSNSVNVVVSNYVMMDLEHYVDAIKEMYRVLKPKGRAIIIFLHPCFCAPKIEKTSDLFKVLTWPPKEHPLNYFNESKTESTWGNFSKPFVHFHRPLSSYWKAFVDSGFSIVNFEETGKHLTAIPDSVAFTLEKPTN